MAEYAYSAASGRYRNVGTGRFVSDRAVRDAVDAVLDAATARMQALTRGLQAGGLDLVSWQQQMAREIKDGHLAAAMTAHGGRAAMTQADYGWAGRRIREQYGYLRRFARQLASGEQPLTDQAVARAALYGQAGRATYEAMRTRDGLARGETEERNILGPADHCPDCTGATRRGWVPLGSLIPIGERQCKANCRCRMERRHNAEEMLRRIRALGDRDVLPLGLMSESIVAALGATTDNNLGIVLTGRQRSHYLARHPEMAPLEQHMREAVLAPDEVHRNRRDRDVRLFYRRVSPSHYVRVAVRMQSAANWRRHSILSYRLAREAEVEANRGRLAWKK